MTQTFNTAEEARDILHDLQRRHLRLPHNSDIHKLIQNLDKMITDLSKLEVAARSVRNCRNRTIHIAVDRHKQQLTDAIKRIDQYLLMAQLMV